MDQPQTGEFGAPLDRFSSATDALIEQLTCSAVEYADGFGERGGHQNLWGLNLTSFMGERMGPVLRRLRDAEAAASAGNLRDLAVQLVDLALGYTYEFSNQPAVHLSLYDSAEAVLVHHFDGSEA